MKTLGRYEIIEEIGRGAMGVVYKGIDPKINRTVALKCLTSNSVQAAEDSKRRFTQEMQALGRLVHPNIVAIHDAGEDPSAQLSYIVMEYIEGISLAQLIKEETVLSIVQITQIGIQICLGLDFAHSKGVIHRDIKPGNILLSNDLNEVKIADFGIARFDDAGLTQTDSLTGTPQYMSPEQCLGETLDGRSDLFALGALLYVLLTKEKAFPGKRVAEVIHRILNESPPSPSSRLRNIPKEMSAVVMKSLEKKPEARFISGREMADALASGLEETDKTLISPNKEGHTFPIEDTKPEGRSLARQARLALYLLLLLVVAGVSAYFLWPSGSKPSMEKGEMHFSIIPPMAEIIINGKRRGISPLSVRLRPDSYEVLVRKEGYHPFEVTIDLPSGESIPINRTLLKEELP